MPVGTNRNNCKVLVDFPTELEESKALPLRLRPRTLNCTPSTQQASLNFPISGHRMPDGFIRSCGLLKLAEAYVNLKLGRLEADKAKAIQKAVPSAKSC